MVVSLIFLGCSNGIKTEYSTKNGKINDTEYTFNYDEKGNLLSFSIQDKSITIISNLKDNKILSYAISSDHYSKVSNIDEFGNIVSSIESMPIGKYKYLKNNNQLTITREN
jgi:ABC-type oligopeptide transport system ATPase subunit